MGHHAPFELMPAVALWHHAICTTVLAAFHQHQLVLVEANKLGNPKRRRRGLVMSLLTLAMLLLALLFLTALRTDEHGMAN